MTSILWHKIDREGREERKKVTTQPVEQIPLAEPLPALEEGRSQREGISDDPRSLRQAQGAVQMIILSYA